MTLGSSACADGTRRERLKRDLTRHTQAPLAPEADSGRPYMIWKPLDSSRLPAQANIRSRQSI